ncbi:MAG: 30S ribosomal protein S20 [Alphaproteobacteria bacterium]
MAHHKSARKRIRRAERRTTINRNRVSRIRTFIRKVEAAIASGDAAAARAAFDIVEPEVQRGVIKGVLHRNTAARRISGLARRINAMGA